MPVFNQEQKIAKTLEALFNCLSLPTRVIIIDDASTDETALAIREFLEGVTATRPWDIRLEFFKSYKPLFETKCDSFGFSLCNTRYVIEVQADMELTDPGFDERLTQAMQSNMDLLMISGRGTEPLAPIVKSYRRTAGSDVSRGRTMPRHITHTLLHRLLSFRANRVNQVDLTALYEDSGQTKNRISPSNDDFSKTGQAGRIGHLIELPLETNPMERRLWLGQTVMRGPLIIDMGKYLELGGLDTEAFFLGYDEHDLITRAYQTKGYRVAYSPISFNSPLADGSTRKRRTFKNEIEIAVKLMRVSRTRKLTALYQLNVSNDQADLPGTEIRDF